MSENSQYQKTLHLAAQLLSHRAMTRATLRDKLQKKGCSMLTIDYALEYLQLHGFLNDEEYARSTVRSYTKRGYGTMRIQQELHRRGVSFEQAQAAIQEHEPAWEQIHTLLEKRLHGDLSDRKEVNKAIAALQRRGFRWDEIRKALKEYGASIDADFD